jgi:hypothetical protein
MHFCAHLAKYLSGRKMFQTEVPEKKRIFCVQSTFAASHALNKIDVVSSFSKLHIHESTTQSQLR